MVGPRVVEAMAAAGYRVRALSRRAPQLGQLAPEVEVIEGDVSDPRAVRAAMEGVAVALHLAARLHVPDPPHELFEWYEHTNVGGTRTVVDAAIGLGVRRLVFFSTIAVYGEGTGGEFHEDSPLAPATFYARTKADAEKLVLAARRSDGTPLGVVLRPGSVYGARVKGNYQRLVHALARRRFIPVGLGTNRRVMVYDRDVAYAAFLASTHSAAAGRVYNVSDGRTHTLEEIIAAICIALGRAAPRFHVPVTVARAVAGLIEDLGRAVGRRGSINRATIGKYTEDIAVDGTRIREELGFVARYDLISGWTEAIQAMRAEGDL
jgi:nucleoside-diphosphate-sugar epimerase